jgi:small-conductance mechanosensitive channel
MTRLQKILALVLTAALAAVLFGWLRTTPLTTPKPQPSATAPRASDLVDQGALNRALQLAKLASGPDEQGFAQSAVRIADHELALAFASALRDLEARPPALDDAARQIEARREKSQALSDADQARVQELTEALKKAPEKQRDALQDQLNLAESQSDLDKDELEEADQDLTEAGGNQQQQIQAMIQQHEAEMQARAAPAAKTAPPADDRGLVRKTRSWWDLRGVQRRLDAAQTAADASAQSLAAERTRLAGKLDADKGGIAALAHHTREARTSGAAPAAATVAATVAPTSHADAAVLLDQTRRIVADQRILTSLDRRVADQRQLARVYRQWSAAVSVRSRAAAHELLFEVGIIVCLGLAVLVLDAWLRRLLDRPKLDRRQVETLRSIARAILRIVAVLLILLILFGVPNDLGTLLGLMGAGITVALKDFIVAFFGWLVLMGRNGMRLGDWVEINGVSGEVIDLGMFRTVLLETGSNDASHPTGRRVTFTNSFAIEGHYFNFSTSGQWLWDELQLVVPATQDPNPIIEAISKQLTEATSASAREAEQEWRRAVPSQGGGAFSGAPTISVKPVLGGIEIGLRYITRANDRSALRATLYQSAVNLLGRKAGTPP